MKYWSKIAIFSYPSCIRRPRYENYRRNIAVPFGIEKLEWCGYREEKKFKDMCNRIDRIPACDWQTSSLSGNDSIWSCRHRAAMRLVFWPEKSSFIPRSSLYTASRSFVQVQWLSVTIQEARQLQRGRATLRAIWKSYSINSSLAYTAVYHNSPCKALARLLCNSFLFYRFDTLDVELLRPRNHGWQYKLLYKPMAEVMGKGDFRPHTAAKPLDRF